MALTYFDENKEPYGLNDSARTHHDGHLGGAYEKLIYIRNDDASRYYTNISVAVVSTNQDNYGEYGDSGWSIKLAFGERRLTEAEWHLVMPGEPLSLPDIGSTEAGNTHQYFPIWIRTYCPGGTPASFRKHQSIQTSYNEKLVGA